MVRLRALNLDVCGLGPGLKVREQGGVGEQCESEEYFSLRVRATPRALLGARKRVVRTRREECKYPNRPTTPCIAKDFFSYGSTYSYEY